MLQEDSRAVKIIAGIFVGGRATRMGGIAKGRLPSTSGESIVERSSRILHEAGVGSLVLVGRELTTSVEPIPTPKLRIDDDPRATGPLAGLLALLAHAHREGARYTIAVACDMPFLDPRLVERLVASAPAPIVAPRDREGRWQPFFARYDPSIVLPIARSFADEGGRRLQDLFERAHATVLELSDETEERTLTDWDTMSDLPPHLRSEKRTS